jgi:hypothetical protein
MAGRKTLDIDYITLRNMRTVNPATNLSPTANYILACDGSGTANWVNTIANINTYGVAPGQKSFTMYLGYTYNPSLSSSTITSVYVPPGLFTSPNLINGAVLTADDPSDNLLFYDTTELICASLVRPQITSFAVSGYLPGGYWSPIPSSRFIGKDYANSIYYQAPQDYTVNIYGLTLANINSNNLVSPTSGVTAGYTATVTINF